jgi:hypothetical protein
VISPKRKRELVEVLGQPVRQHDDDRKNHRRGPDDRRPDQHGLGRRLKRVAGAVVLLEQMLCRLEIRVDPVVSFQRLLHVRNLLDERQLEDRLGIVGDGAIGVHRDRYGSHPEKAECRQTECEDRRRGHERPEPGCADRVRTPHQHDNDHAKPVRAEISGHESRQDAERGPPFAR